MTLKEFKELLAPLPEDLPVYHLCPYYGDEEVLGVEVSKNVWVGRSGGKSVYIEAVVIQ